MEDKRQFTFAKASADKESHKTKVWIYLFNGSFNYSKWGVQPRSRHGD
jgi:hypothetical protein